MIKCLFLLSLMCVAHPLCFSEVIRLKNGKTIEADIIDKTGSCVKVNIAGVPVTYYLEDIAEIKGLENAAPKQAKNTVTCKVNKKFYLKALSDVYNLKFCMPLPQQDSLYQKISDIVVYPEKNAFIKADSGVDIPIFYFGALSGANTAIVGVNYTVTFDVEPSTIDRSKIADTYSKLDAEYTRYIGSESDIDIDDPLIKEKMHTITDSLGNPYDKAKALYDFITSYIHYDMNLAMQVMSGGWYEPAKPMDTLQSGKGICYDIAKLYVALARSAGIPSRVVRGVAFQPQEGVNTYVVKIGHAWAEIYLPTYGWQKVDPTSGIAEKDRFFCFNEISHIAEEYGLMSAREFGSLEKGWSLQLRTKSQVARIPLQVAEEIEIEVVPNSPSKEDKKP
ncbi:MAG: transglutaminase-like domain-containing protein [Candidatus Omnitrophota bacterium]